MDLDSSGIQTKRTKRHLREIKDLVTSLLTDYQKQLPNCVEAENHVTIEGLRKIVHQQAEELEQCKKENASLKTYMKDVEEIPTLRKMNMNLLMSKKVIEEDMQLLQEKLERRIEEESTRAVGFEVQNKELQSKLDKYDTDMKNKLKQIETQRQADAKVLGKYMDEIERQKMLNVEIKSILKDSKLKELDLKNKLKEMEMKFELEKQSGIASTAEVEKRRELAQKELQETIEGLKNQYADLLTAKSESRAEHDQNQNLLLLYNKLKQQRDTAEVVYEKLNEADKKLREYKRYKEDYEQKIKELEAAMVALKECEYVHQQKQRLLDAWTQLTKRHVQDEEATPEALERHLFGRFTEIQVLTHHKTTAERLNEDLSLKLAKAQEALNDSETVCGRLNHQIRTLEAKYKEAQGENALLEQRTNLLKIEMKGERIPSELMLRQSNEMDAQFDAQRANLVTEAVKAELESTQSYIRSLESERERLKAASVEVHTLKYEVNRIMLEKDNLEKQNNELQINAMKLKDQLALNEMRSASAKSKDGHVLKVSTLTESLNTTDENDEVTAMKNQLLTISKQKEELFEKCKAIKEYYKQETTTYRETILGLLGWNVRSEVAENGVRYRLSSLYSTHDGEFVFYPKESDVSEDKYSIPEYNLYFDGYYITKWTRDNIWRNKLRVSNSFPSFLASTCLEELESIRSQFRGRIPKNSSGMLLPAIALQT